MIPGYCDSILHPRVVPFVIITPCSGRAQFWELLDLRGTAFFIGMSKPSTHYSRWSTTGLLPTPWGSGSGQSFLSRLPHPSTFLQKLSFETHVISASVFFFIMTHNKKYILHFDPIHTHIRTRVRTQLKQTFFKTLLLRTMHPGISVYFYYIPFFFKCCLAPTKLFRQTIFHRLSWL